MYEIAKITNSHQSYMKYKFENRANNGSLDIPEVGTGA
jgi:hypothetical protein